MTKKFDVVIGNPPYQEESIGGATDMPPVYHHFMDAAFQLGRQAVLITPARFLANAGSTPKAWNAKMLADPHLKVAHYEADSKKVFPGLASPIKGGIAVTHRDENRQFGPIVSFAKFPEITSILSKVEAANPLSIVTVATNRSSNTYRRSFFDENPEAAVKIGHSNLSQILSNAFTVLEDYFESEDPDDENYVAILGVSNRRRVFRWMHRANLSLHASAEKWKVALSEANGTGQFGETLSSPTVIGPGCIVTNTFITIGELGTEAEAGALLKYLKSKFARTLLGILKVTQHTSQQVWKHVPLQDFTAESDIDWSKPIPEIDQQLYAKYGLGADEVEFIESNVKPMS